jgi:hypothetical protein
MTKRILFPFTLFVDNRATVTLSELRLSWSLNESGIGVRVQLEATVFMRFRKNANTAY